jgi:hypothetical protein
MRFDAAQVERVGTAPSPFSMSVSLYGNAPNIRCRDPLNFELCSQNGQKQIGEACGATVRQYSLFCKPSGRVSQVVQGAASLIF